MNYILETNNLKKQFGQNTVVNNISMHIKKGSIYGFLGKNGAGKTTTIRLIMGLLKPTNGEIYLFGESVKKCYPFIFSKIGTIIEYPGFYTNLNAIDNLRICCYYMGVKDDVKIEKALSIVGLEGTKNKKFRDFSLGMKQRLGIARALVHDPELLILDEPTNGLDPSGIKEIRSLLKDLSEEHKKTILISSHILSEIQQLASHVGIIHEGNLLIEDAISELEKNYEQYIDLKVDDTKRTVEILNSNFSNFKYEIFNNYDLRILNKINNTAEITKFLVNQGISVFEIFKTKQNLEEYFLNLTTNEDGFYE